MAMSQAFLDAHFGTGAPVALAPPPPRRPLRWRRAWRVLRELLDDPERTEKVFELLEATGGDGGEGTFQRFLAQPSSRELLAERPSLLAALSDRGALARLPEGSFGRAYLEFREARGFAPGDIGGARDRAGIDADLDPVRDWFFERTNTMHDLWHVLTGYGTDEAGEAALLAFTNAQMPGRGTALLVLAAACIGPKRLSLDWQRYLFRAWRRGRRADPLFAAPYERLLGRPLDEVRLRLGIEPLFRAHPGGVLTGDRTDASPAAG